MKKKLFITFFFNLLLLSCVSNEQHTNILESKNIPEIEEYLSKAHPEDPKRKILQQRLIALKNADWVKGRKDAKPMAARPIVMEIPSKATLKKNSPEKEALFQKLLAETPEEHKQKTVKLLNNMFDQDTGKNEVIILVKNNSDCNLVLEISGKKFYQLPVPTKGENSIIIEKGSYSFTGSICDVAYKNNKEITTGIAIILSNPEEKDASSPAEQPQKAPLKKKTTGKKSTSKKGKKK